MDNYTTYISLESKKEALHVKLEDVRDEYLQENAKLKGRRIALITTGNILSPSPRRKYFKKISLPVLVGSNRRISDIKRVTTDTLDEWSTSEVQKMQKATQVGRRSAVAIPKVTEKHPLTVNDEGAKINEQKCNYRRYSV